MNIESTSFDNFINNFFYPLLSGLLIALIVFVIKQFKKIKIWYKKLRYKFFPLDAKIVFSLEYKEGLKTESYFAELKKQFNSLNERTGIFKNDKIVDISGIYNITNIKDAEEFLLSKNVDMLIWGRFSTDDLKINGELINIPEFNFQYKYLNDKDNRIGKFVNLDVSSRMKLQKFNPIKDKNSLTDIQILSKSVFDSASYILAITLKLYGRTKESTDYLERLFNNISDPNNRFKNSLIPHLMNNYEILIGSFVSKINPNVKEGMKYCESYCRIDHSSVWVLCNLAYCKYSLGFISEADAIIEKAYLIDPTYPSCQLNLAFKMIREKNYKRAFKLYDKFFNKNLEWLDQINFSHMEVIDFFEQEFAKLRDPALLYGSAILNYIFGDKETAKEDFVRFLKLADTVKMKEMVRKAKTLVNKC